MMYAAVFCISLLCAAACGAADLTVRVQSSAGAPGEGAPIADAAVILEPTATPPATTTANAVVDQINKRFVPRLTVIRTGTAVSFPNSDHIRHQVYSFSPAKTFNLKLYAGSPKTDVVFDKPGMVVLGCNIHDTMVGFIAVVDTPYFGVTAADGSVKLQAPAGNYRLRVWHAAMAGVFAPKAVQLGAGSEEMPVTLNLDHDAAAPAAWAE
jgi:plastocyanin